MSLYTLTSRIYGNKSHQRKILTSRISVNMPPCSFILPTFPGIVTRGILKLWLWAFCLDLTSQIWLGTKHYKLKQLVQYLCCSLMHFYLYIAVPCLVTQSNFSRWLNWLCWWLFSCIFLTGK